MIDFAHSLVILPRFVFFAEKPRTKNTFLRFRGIWILKQTLVPLRSLERHLLANKTYVHVARQ